MRARTNEAAPDSAPVEVGAVGAPGGGGKATWKGFRGVLSYTVFVYATGEIGNDGIKGSCADGFLPFSLTRFEKKILFNGDEIKVD